MAQEKTIRLDDVSRGIDKGINTADEERAATLERLQFVRQAKTTSLTTEQARLTTKYGADHPRVQALQSRVATNEGLLSNLVAETGRARTEVPTVDERTWVLHGYVRDQNGTAAPNVTVALFDQKGSRLDKLGYACTNGEGYFRVVARDSKNIGANPAYIRALNNQGATLYADSKALAPELGGVDYREITLSGEAVICVPPPEPPAGPPDKPPDTPPSQAPDATADAWVVRGRVTDESGIGLAGLMVSVYDKDLIFDDRLGETKTRPDGTFSMIYHAEDFRDVIERKPDIYLKVLDQRGNTIYSSKNSVRYNAGRTETFEITIAAGKLKQ